MGSNPIWDSDFSRVYVSPLYNNQINVRALISQSAMVYWASKLKEKSRVFWIITWDVGRTLEEFVNHSSAAGVIYEFFSCSTNIPRGLSAYKQ